MLRGRKAHTPRWGRHLVLWNCAPEQSGTGGWRGGQGRWWRAGEGWNSTRERSPEDGAGYRVLRGVPRVESRVGNLDRFVRT